jgi:hypothetical protein
VLAAGVVATTARADGDPASDYLLSQQVFFPVDYFNVPAASKARFSAVVSQANRSGFKIRIALIKSAYDMGSVTALYRKPRQYAKFLSLELSFVYHQRLLIVMPNGFGFHWPRHRAAPAYRVLSTIPIQKGDGGLLQAAQSAVQRLAASAGVKVAAPDHVVTPAQRNSHDRVVIIVLAIAAVLSIAATRFLLRRRGSNP